MPFSENKSRPSDAGPSRITTLHAGQGAEVTTRKNAAHAADLARRNAERRFNKRHSSERLSAAAGRASRRLGAEEGTVFVPEGPERTKKNIFIIVGGAILALVVLFFLVRCVTSALTPKPTATDQSQDLEQPSDPAQDQTASDGEVSIHGVKYSLTQAEDGAWVVLANGVENFLGGGEQGIRLAGTPSGLIVYNGALVIPESLEDGWDVIAYMPADGSMPMQVADADGNVVHGAGSIVSATLDGSSVVVTDSTGATTNVAL